MTTNSPNNSHESARLKGATFILLSIFFMGVNNAILKWLSGGMSASQILFVRSAVIVIIVLAIAWRKRGSGLLRINDWRGHAIWGSIQFFNAIVFIMGVGYLPLADTIALTFAGPLFLTALAIPLLGERIGWHRWAAVFVGFIGILIITRPSSAAFQWVALFPLGAALSGAVRDIASRKVTAREGSTSVLLTSSLIAMAGTVVTAPFDWVVPTASDLGLGIVTGLCVLVGQFLMIDAFRYAEAKVLAPLRYSAILWSVILGYLVWGDLPDSWTIVGTAVVIASGLYILHREYRARR
ncbi:MAG: DMT family transporter [Rhodospirillaceae bacterium]|jgi:drug/metabolite transporter (DMT)-like permease|nr:DMT family transporter [Rhodospirillaceae bacterium]MBT5665935.1 DMT family transporter [Rhodospirillaceae bacterium]MBT5810038.1 DMT family transporter [Rhodospirillaceae bacterium]